MKRLVFATTAVVVAGIATIVVLARSESRRAVTATEQTTNTVRVERGRLSSAIAEVGIVTYRAQADGSPYPVINQARGTYTALPAAGDEVGCGDVLYRVDEQPVLLLCGTVPAYRDLATGDTGNDVRQLNENLHHLGYDRDAAIDSSDDRFTMSTQAALAKLQRDKGVDATGELALATAVFLPEAVRIADTSAQLGGPAEAGALVAHATSEVPEIQVDLDPSQQSAVKAGDHAEITLPTNASVTGKVDRLGTVTQLPPAQNGGAAAATIPVFITLDDPTPVRPLAKAPVRVAITTTAVDDVLSVPVTALVGKDGGGFAVEVVRDASHRDLVAVQLGVFDTAAGRVGVDGALHEGDQVVVPSS